MRFVGGVRRGLCPTRTFLMVDASVVATNWDSHYQSLADVVTALGRAIDDSTPGDAASLEKVALAGAEIEAICAGIS